MSDIIIGIIDLIVSLFTGLIEAIVGIFSSGGEGLGAGAAIVTGSVFVAELGGWLALFIFELCIALFTWRKPKKISKPVWRKNKS